MVNWHRFTPTDFEYDFDRDKLAAHHVTFEEAAFAGLKRSLADKQT